MRFPRMTFMALLALAAALPLQAYNGVVLGQPAIGSDFGMCENGEQINADDATEPLLFMYHKNSSNFLYVMGNELNGCNGFGTPLNPAGTYDCFGANFAPPPLVPADTVWVIVTLYDPNCTAEQHCGWLAIDSGNVNNQAFSFNVTQRLRPIAAEPGVKFGGNIATDPTTGVDFRFYAPVEFGRDEAGSVVTCRVAGDAETTTTDDRPIAGYNIYRVDAALVPNSTPQDYMNNYVGFVPVGAGGLDVGNAGASAAVNDNDVNDAFGVEGNDWDGDTTVGPSDDAILIFSDTPARPVNPPPDYTTSTFNYVFQPVLKPSNSMAAWPEGNADVDGDTVNDPGTQDLNGDTVPEFYDPSGNGLGLMANLGGNRVILISSEVAADGTTPTPAGGSLQFEGVFNPKTKSFDLQFISSLGTDLAGFNLYRSTMADSTESYTKVNADIIPAQGTALATYLFSDPLKSRLRGGSATYYYKVEAVSLDGSSDLYGPYQVIFPGAADQRRGRGLR